MVSRRNRPALLRELGELLVRRQTPDYSALAEKHGFSTGEVRNYAQQAYLDLVERGLLGRTGGSDNGTD